MSQKNSLFYCICKFCVGMKCTWHFYKWTRPLDFVFMNEPLKSSIFFCTPRKSMFQVSVSNNDDVSCCIKNNRTLKFAYAIKISYTFVIFRIFLTKNINVWLKKQMQYLVILWKNNVRFSYVELHVCFIAFEWEIGTFFRVIVFSLSLKSSLLAN